MSSAPSNWVCVIPVSRSTRREPPSARADGSPPLRTPRGTRPVHDRVRHSSPRWAGRQCMIWRSFSAFANEGFVHPLVGLEQVVPAPLVLRRPSRPSNQVTGRRARRPTRRRRIGGRDDDPRPRLSPRAISSAGGGELGGGGRWRSVKRKRAAACTQEASTFLESPPVQATVLPAIGPRCSSKVITSAMIWQGCESLVSAVDHRHGRGLRELEQSESCSRDADHDRVDVARQHPGRVGVWSRRRPSCISEPVKHQRLAAELTHADVEGDAGAGQRACRKIIAKASCPLELGDRPWPLAAAPART